MNKAFIEQLYQGLNGFIEIREIQGSGDITCRFLTFPKLLKYRIPQDKTIYIGIMTRKEHKGTKEACIHAGALWADLDNVKLEQAKERIASAGLPLPTWCISSGHGIHAYWKLNKPLDNPEPYLKAIVKATRADNRCAENARTMRLPGSRNFKIPDEPQPCKVIEHNNTAYNLDDFKLDITEAETIKDAGTKQRTEAATIPELDNALLPPCFREMGKGVKQGCRNFAEGRLTKYLQREGLTKAAALAIILKWNNNNTPRENQGKLIKDFYSYWHADYKLLGCCLDNPELQNILSEYCDKPACFKSINFDKLKLDKSTAFNNRIFNYFRQLSGNILIVYGVLLKYREGLTQKLLIEQLTARETKKTCMCEKTMRKQLSALKRLGLVECTRGNARRGKENFYKAIAQGTFGMGYTLVSSGALTGAICRQVKPAEFKLYVLLLKYAYGKPNCYPSQIVLAKELNVQQALVSQMLNALEKYGYIKRCWHYDKGKANRVYTLLV